MQRALEAASERLYKDAAGTNPGASETTAGQRRADALGLMAETALAADLDRGTSGDRYQVVVHVDDGVLEHDNATGQSVLEDGQYVSAETSRRLACDATKVVMHHNRDGQVLDVGRKTRTVPPAFAGRSRPGIADAASLAAALATATPTTFATGRKVAPLDSTIWCCSVAAITGRSTRRDSQSNSTPTVRPASPGRTVVRSWPRHRHHVGRGLPSGRRTRALTLRKS